MVSERVIARVAIDSPLPQLDRLFDYSVPQDLRDQIRVGQRVRVRFGRSKNLLDAYVIELDDRTDFDGVLAEVMEIASTNPVLKPEIYELCRRVADRQAVPVSDVLKLALPKYSATVDKSFNIEFQSSAVFGSSERTTKLLRPCVIDGASSWVIDFIEQAQTRLQLGQSVLVIAPDFRDHDEFMLHASQVFTESKLISYSSKQTGSKRYHSFMQALSDQGSIVVGSRAAMYAPVNNLGLILILDDGDWSHQEIASPYIHTRDLAFIRQGISKCDIHFAGYARSSELQRLIGIGFLSDQTSPFPAPSISVSEAGVRVDTLAWNLIRAQLPLGPVLVQVASRGVSSSLFCSSCEKRASCSSCNGPLWSDERSHTRCRWCNAINMNYRCECGEQRLRQGRPGSTRTAAEFGKAFAGARIIEANSDSAIARVDSANTIVVATPGSEPMASNGYAGVVILDAQLALAKDSLRATEDAVRVWSNTVAKAAKDGKSALVGVAGDLANQFSLWNQEQISKRELASRVELRFPPAIRMASVTATVEQLALLRENLKMKDRVEQLGPVPITHETSKNMARLIIKYEYSQGAELASDLKAAALIASAGLTSVSKAGRNQRVFRIKMDDIEVI
jgi:primosomal protein N' (replication factor Y)